MMDGMYSKVFAAKKNSPSDCYLFFIEILWNTIREEIAQCLEKAYRKITYKDAAMKLRLTSEEEARRFGIMKGWKMRRNHFVFVQEPRKKKEKIPVVNMAKQSLNYARELVMIV